ATYAAGKVVAFAAAAARPIVRAIDGSARHCQSATSFFFSVVPQENWAAPEGGKLPGTFQIPYKKKTTDKETDSRQESADEKVNVLDFRMGKAYKGLARSIRLP
ncbi:unnamed protein product, partial [Amoebophrya sp. A25]